MLQTARAITAAGSVARCQLIRYRPQGVRVAYRDIPTPGDDAMSALAAMARGAGVQDVVIV